MGFGTRVRHLLSIYKVDPNTKVEFWCHDRIYGSDEGQKGVISLQETKLWSEVKSKQKILSLLYRDFGPDEVLVYCVAMISDEYVEGVFLPEVFEKLMRGVPIIAAEDREAWIYDHTLLYYDKIISLAENAASDTVNHYRSIVESAANEAIGSYRKEKADYIASHNLSQTKNQKDT